MQATNKSFLNVDYLDQLLLQCQIHFLVVVVTLFETHRLENVICMKRRARIFSSRRIWVTLCCQIFSPPPRQPQQPELHRPPAPTCVS
eukprot:3935352-Rhodomonas_salina.4